MMKSYSNFFPSVESATEEGLLAIGGSYSLDMLLNAYHEGIFPWPINTSGDEELILAWFSPNPRGLLYGENFRISRSFTKFLKRHPYRVSFNQNFQKVIENCKKVHEKINKGTWITNDLIEGYLLMHQKKMAYSVEVFEGEELIGGLYGVNIGHYVTGESMFHKKDNASKLALYSLMMKLKEAKISWLDTQMVTPILDSLGGKEYPRADFIRELKELVKRESILF